MSFKQPDQNTIFTYINGTHAVERLQCTPGEISATYAGKAPIPNPFADGHLRAVNYIFTKLAGHADFPVRNIALLDDRFQAPLAANWLRQLHTEAFYPLVNSPLTVDDPNAPKRGMVGSFRSHNAWNAFSPAPPPALLPAIVNNWLKDIATLDAEVRPKMDVVFGVTKGMRTRLETAAYKSSLLMATAQPFGYGNNRFGRLVENALRLHWRMSWKLVAPGSDYEKYTEDLVEFQTADLKEVTKRARETMA